jgi:programmed cell death 8 (apoptosis-inducing factor)
MITNEKDLPYMRPPLSKEIWYNKNESSEPNLTFRQWNGEKRR